MSVVKRVVLAIALLLLAAPAGFAADAPIEIQWWHAMTGVNAELVTKFADEFDHSQARYKIVPVFKGSYADTMQAAIAAYRAGDPPAIVQVFEVGTATMMAAKGAIKPVYQLMADAHETFDPKAYLPAVTSYFSTPDGKMLSLPFNSSTAILYYNKAAFTKAGLDPSKPPKTWPEVFADAKKIRAAGYSCGFTTSWLSWIQIEQFSAWHNLPIGTKANGMAGTDTVLTFNNPTVVRHIANLVAAEKDGSFVYGGRTMEPDQKFISGECGMTFNSSGFYGLAQAGAKFPFGVGELPYYPDVKGAPQNSIIGGASLWVMGGKSPEVYKGVAEFLSFLSQTPQQLRWHEATGYLPITKAAYEAAKASGFYAKHPGTELPVIQMIGKPPTENSRGLRFGNFVQIRDVIAEELENAFAHKKTPKQALDDAVSRGNTLLRQFEAATK
ncbi:MAG TPA: sn-glycerol-3-phosphate ABC transporter substrate-binding protein UgpB [Stellaceae bacterium]|nr:sn-glycerol-3-phosphate ABC transporter substrate-binding protein UgpB [Stellaceae bacterium]